MQYRVVRGLTVAFISLGLAACVGATEEDGENIDTAEAEFQAGPITCTPANCDSGIGSVTICFRDGIHGTFSPHTELVGVGSYTVLEAIDEDGDLVFTTANLFNSDKPIVTCDYDYTHIHGEVHVHHFTTRGYVNP